MKRQYRITLTTHHLFLCQNAHKAVDRQLETGGRKYLIFHCLKSQVRYVLKSDLISKSKKDARKRKRWSLKTILYCIWSKNVSHTNSYNRQREKIVAYHTVVFWYSAKIDVKSIKPWGTCADTPERRSTVPISTRKVWGNSPTFAVLILWFQLAVSTFLYPQRKLSEETNYFAFRISLTDLPTLTVWSWDSRFGLSTHGLTI